ncbi:uncharacterized protein VTP21DRAFT_2479 [Calcarisporiella thermophila]|uniref:uncharacterized protein n=1 Tax=Calcarisporiella thermophila TaxID=911321 RepID=UPI003743A320
MRGIFTLESLLSNFVTCRRRACDKLGRSCLAPPSLRREFGVLRASCPVQTDANLVSSPASSMIPTTSESLDVSKPAKTLLKWHTSRFWTNQDDKLLLDLYAQHGPDWTRISSALLNRNPAACRRRWERLNRPEWTMHDDWLLLQAVKQFGTERWAAITSCLPNRHVWDVRERYYMLRNRHLKKKGATTRTGIHLELESWNMEERRRFVKLVREHGGGDFEFLSNFFPGKTEVQLKAVYRYYFETKSFWNAILDRDLTQAVKLLGEGDWEAVGEKVGAKADDCKQRWFDHLKPGVVRGAWALEDDTRLLALVREYEDSEVDWYAVASAINRKSTSCKARWNYLTSDSVRKGRWEPEEDEKLQEAVEKHKDDWLAIADMVGRSPNQCRHRWRDNFDVDLKIGKWTPEEDAKLHGAYERYGSSWQKIAKHVGRGEKQCRDRWITTSKPGIKLGPWTPEEDRKLLELYRKLGPRWAEISNQMEGRTSHRCKQRFRRDLKNGVLEHGTYNRKQTLGVRSGYWTEEEDALLDQAVDKFGRRWQLVAQMVGTRTNLQCRDRYDYRSSRHEEDPTDKVE